MMITIANKVINGLNLIYLNVPIPYSINLVVENTTINVINRITDKDENNCYKSNKEIVNSKCE